MDENISDDGEENIEENDQLFVDMTSKARKRRNSHQDPRSTRLSILHRINEQQEEEDYDFEKTLENLMNKKLEVKSKPKIRTLTPRNKTEYHKGMGN